jgi:hypothetical protein
MSIRKTIITAIVGLTLVAAIVPVGSVNALTTAELQAQINALTAQLAQLTGTTTPATVSTGACAGVTFSRNLTTGSTGSDVKCLQTILNQSAATQISTTGAGSPGNETSYFGGLTLVAVKKFQTNNGMTPANQVGPMTRAKLNSMLAGGTIVLPPVVTPGQTGPVSAMLSSTTPAQGSLIGGQATAGLVDVNFIGNGTVTSVTLQRTGISDQNTLTNVYLYDGNVRITDGYSFNVSGQLVMNGLNIAVNGSKVISVKADVLSGAVNTASSIVASLVAYTANGTASTVNVVGNTMMIVTGSSATVSFTANTVGTANVNAGTTGYTFWSAPLQVNTRTVVLKTANFRMIGSAPVDALSSIKMYIDGVDTGKVATVISINGSNYASFDLTSSPINLATGSHTIDLRADVQKGTNRNVTVSIQQAADLTITDPQVGVNIAVSGTVPNNAGTISILTGSATVVIDPTFTSATNVSAGAANVVIGRFKVHAYGEDIKVSTLNVTPKITLATSTGATCTTDAAGVVTSATGTCGLNNVTLYFNGSQVGSQVNWASTNGSAGATIPFTLGSQVIALAGQDGTLEVRADLQTTNNVSYTGGTVSVILPIETVNGQGMSSQNTMGVPTGLVQTTGLAIQSATLIVSKNTGYASQSVSPNTAGVKIGSFVVQNQSTSEAVRLTSLNVVITPSVTALTNFSALRTSDTTGAGATPLQPTGNDTFSVADVLQPGSSITIDIFANTGGDTAGSIVTKLTVASIGSTSNISSAGTQQTGQTITLGNGTVGTPSIIVSTTTPAQYIAAAGGSVNGSQSTFNFVSAGGASTITELKFTVSGSDTNPTQTVERICVGTVCGSPAVVSGTQTVYLTGLSLAVPNGGELSQNVQISYGSVGTSGVTPGSTAVVTLTYVKYTSGGATQTPLTVSVASPTVTLVGSLPVVTIPAASGTLQIGGGLNKIGQVSVKADAKGSIRVRQILFTVSSSGFDGSGALITDTPGSTPFLTLAGSSTQITGNYCDISGANITCELGGNGNTSYANDFIIPAGNTQIFDLYATVGGAAASTTTKASVSTKITAAGFLWDDASTAGVSGTGLAGTLVPSFPAVSSFTVTQ